MDCSCFCFVFVWGELGGGERSGAGFGGAGGTDGGCWVRRLALSTSRVILFIRLFWRGNSFAYGNLFGLLPVLCLEWFVSFLFIFLLFFWWWKTDCGLRFGLKSYSSNNGLLVLAPAIFGSFFFFPLLQEEERERENTHSAPLGQLTNYLFGRIYDSNTPTVGRLCTKGKYCYRSSFRITIAMAVLSVGLSVVAGVRRSRRGK